MVIATVIEAMTSEIRRILVDFSENQDLETLTPGSASAVTRAVQSAVASAGLAGFRAFLQSHEETSDTVVRDDKVYRYKFASAKTFLTVFGSLEVQRRLYQQDKGGDSYVPLDAKWGMEKKYVTPEVQEACLFGQGLNTPQEVEALLEKCALFQPSASTIKRLAQDAEEWLEGHKAEVDEAIRQEEQKPSGTRTLVGSLDGVNVLLDEPGSKKGRPPERPQKGKEEDKSSYKNAMVGTVSCYTAERQESGELTSKRLATAYVARMPEDRAVTAKEEFERELSHAEAQLGPDVQKLLLLDASRGLWNYVESTDRFNDYEKAVDFFHSTEHLSSAAEALFGKKSEEGQAWYNKYRTKLLEEDDAVESLLRSIHYYGGQRKLSGARKKQLRDHRTFFQNNGHRMPYASLRRRGLPIGSGVVEAACKTIVKQRLGRSGMRWSRKGGQAILNLRTYIKSDRWDLFWKHYSSLRKAS